MQSCPANAVMHSEHNGDRSELVVAASDGRMALEKTLPRGHLAVRHGAREGERERADVRAYVHDDLVVHAHGCNTGSRYRLAMASQISKCYLRRNT